MNLLERLKFAHYSMVHRRSDSYIRRWQGKHLQRLLQHAYKNVPMWKKLLDEKGLALDSIRDVGDIEKLPVTDRQSFVGKMPEDYIDNSRVADTTWSVTSGTSGKPLRFLMGDMAHSVEYASASYLRFYWWRGEYGRNLSHINIARIKVRGVSLPHRYLVRVEEYLSDPRSSVARIAEYQPEILSSYPSIILDIAQHIAADPTFPKVAPRFVATFGEMLAPSVRKFIEESLHCEIYDRYGLEELGVIGLECARHDDYHLSSDSLIVEVTDDAYRPLPPGRVGRIVVTDLFNYNMPFIRYDTGDQGRIISEPCACGLSLPRIKISGRYSTFLQFGSRRVHHLELDGTMDGFMDTVLQYQIVKRSESDVLVRVVPGPGYGTSVEQRIRRNIQELLGNGLSIHVSEVKKIPHMPSGKCQIVVDESVGV